MELFSFENLIQLPIKERAADAITNQALRIAILADGSRKLFSTPRLMDRVFGQLQDNQPPYEIDKSIFTFSNLSACRSIGAANCYTFRPNWVSSKKHIVYFCGGAFIREAMQGHIEFVDKLAVAAKAEATIVFYPKTPTYTYADTYEISAKLYKELAEKHGAENIILMGDSCGGTIALALCGFFKKVGLPMPGGVVGFSPLCDMSVSNPASEGYTERDPMLGIDGLRMAGEKWSGARDIRDPAVNPMDMNVGDLPRLLLICGTEEILLPDIRLFARHVHDNGGKVELDIYDGMYHIFHIQKLHAAQHAMNRVVEWMNK